MRRLTVPTNIAALANDPTTLVCAVCGKTLDYIAPAHLRTHGMTTREYRDQFPASALTTEAVKRTRSNGSTDRRLAAGYGGRLPDARLCSFLLGGMLGDGSLENRKRNARYVEGGANEQYLRWKHDLLAQYFPCRFVERLSSPHSRSGKRYLGWWVRTTSDPYLTNWWRRWYDDKKVVCREDVIAHLDALALSVWFCDDGHLGRGDDRNNAYLYTMAFGAGDVCFLRDLLLERFGLGSTLREDSTGHPFLYFGAANRPRLLAILGQNPLPGMAYKLLPYNKEATT